MRDQALLDQVAWTRRLERMEPAAGFGSRIASLNRKRLRPFLAEMQINARDIDKGVEDAVRALAFVGRADPQELLRFTPAPGARGELARVAGETLQRSRVHRTFFRFCPHCVAEDLAAFDGPKHTRPWLRLAWTIGHFRSCDVHHVALVAARPLRRRFEPFDFSETIEIGVLPELGASIAETTPTAPSPFQAWITARLEGRKSDANWLDEVALHAGAAFAEALGVSMLHPPKVKPTELSEVDWAKAADAGYGAASAGPDALRKILEDLTNAESSMRGFWGLRDTYGHVYGLLQKTLDDPAYAPFRDVVRSFALESMPIEPGTDVLGVVSTDRRVHTVRSAAMESGAHARTIRRFFERKGLVGDRATSGITDHRATVAAEEIERVTRDLKGALSTPKVRAEFVIDRVHLTRLIALGYLVPVTDSAERRYGKHRFTRASVEAMLDRLFDGAVTVHAPTDRQLPLGEARHAATCTLDEVFELAFGGKLAWKGLLEGRRDYGALLLDADELTRIVRDKPKRQCLTRAEFCSFAHGMEKRKTPQFLIDQGLLIETEEYSPDARRLIPVITVESAEAFRERYVTLGELAQKNNMHHKQVVSVLNKAKIREVFDVAEAGCFIYERPAVAGLLRVSAGQS